MKRYAIYLLALLFTAVLSSCGGGSSSSLGSAPVQTSGYQLTKDKLAFDVTNPANPIIPLPNDILWAKSGGYLYLPPEQATDPATEVLYRAMDALKIKGFSPNAPIAIPLATNEVALSQAQLQDNVKLIDLTGYVGAVLKGYLSEYLQSVPDDKVCLAFASNQDNQTLAIGCFSDIMGYYYKTNQAKLVQIVQSVSPLVYAPVVVKQNGATINAYPAKPLNPGHQYACVVLNGIDNLEEASMFKLIAGDTPLTGKYAELEPLREKYQLVFKLLATLGINKDNILEMFTFTTADKTLGIMDYAAIEKALKEGSGASALSISGYSYADLASSGESNQYIMLDSLSDLPLMCQSAYDNATLRNLFHLPQITDGASFLLTPNVYQAAYIQKILTLHPITTASNIPVVCALVFDNASLYDKVNIAQANLTAVGGFMVYIHGLGRTKNDINYFSDSFPNLHIFAIDLPWHGDRIPPNPTLASMCPTDANGACFLTSNAIMDVMNIYQSLIDIHTLVKFLALNDYTKLAQILGHPVPIYYASQSMGSIIGSMFLRIDNVTRSAFFDAVNAKLGLNLPDHNFITRAVLNVGGAGYASILNEATNSLILNMLKSVGIERGLTDFTKYYLTLYLFQTLLDPVDPMYMARDASVSDKVIIQSANHDTVVPNISNQLLALTFGFNSYTPVDCSSTTQVPPAEAGWYMFGTGDNWVNHGFFVSTENLAEKYPEAISHLNQAYVDNAETLARKQANQFFTLLMGQ